MRAKNLVLGIQHDVLMDKNDLIFDGKSDHLKYFFEPKPDSITTWSPDWLNKTVVNTINNDSLNERYNYIVDKPSNTYRIITIGDSFTYGQYVQTSDNFSELLEDRLNKEINCPDINKFEVINLGVPGYDVQYTVERFLKRGIKYSPDLVIWLLNSWDLDKINEIYFPIQNKYYDMGYKPFDELSKTYELSNLVRQYFREKYTEDKILQYQKDLMNKLKNIYPEKLAILNFKDTLKYINFIEDYVKDQNNYRYFPYLTNIMLDKTLVFEDNHPNEKGHQKIAGEIFSLLLKNYLPNCSISN